MKSSADSDLNYTRLDMNRLQDMYTMSPHHKFLYSSATVLGLLILSFFGTLLYSFNVSKSELTNIKAASSGKTAVATTTPPPGAIVIGTDASLPPMESYNGNGKLVGYDIDLVNGIAKAEHLTIVFRNIPYDGLFKALDAKQIDLVVSAVEITEDRKVKYLFSDPYLNGGQVIIARKADGRIKTSADLKGKRLGEQQGTVGEQEAKRQTTPALVSTFKDFTAAAAALETSKVDAIVTDLPGAKTVVSGHPTLKIVGTPFTSDYYGIMTRKESSKLIETVNDGLMKLQQKGTMQELRHKWFE